MVSDLHPSNLMNSGQPNPTWLSLCTEVVSIKCLASADGENDDFGDAVAARAVTQLACDTARWFCLWTIIATKKFACACKVKCNLI